MITEWRQKLPEKLQWLDEEPVANNINDARLREKFYSVQYIIYRPFLHAALNLDFVSTRPPSPPNSDSGGVIPTVPARGSEIGPLNPDSEPRRAETIKLAVVCINATIRSTIAFDSILDRRRLVVTNIMGTAHA